VNLLGARVAASNARRELLEGVDPLDKKRRQIHRRLARVLPAMTFDDCAKHYIEDHGSAWRSAKHREQWKTTLRSYVSPHFGSVSVRNVSIEHVLRALRSIWQAKTVTATRVRERVERILSWAAVRGYRASDNPARWDGHLEMLLPAPAKLRKTKHHAALPIDEACPFLRGLRSREATTSRALEFTILTASRTREAVWARWDEMDLARRTWTVPAERMKTGRTHRVPLSHAAISLLTKQVGLDATCVFPSATGSTPISTGAMPKVLSRRRRDVTVHGFRSTFRDWAAEMTDHPRELAEMALAHPVGSAVENAYRRGDLLERRRRLMEDWAAWCMGVTTVPSSSIQSLPALSTSLPCAQCSWGSVAFKVDRGLWASTGYA
jgi:integrase